jgi:hypothetical protein
LCVVVWTCRWGAAARHEARSSAASERINVLLLAPAGSWATLRGRRNCCSGATVRRPSAPLRVACRLAPPSSNDSNEETPRQRVALFLAGLAAAANVSWLKLCVAAAASRPASHPTAAAYSQCLARCVSQQARPHIPPPLLRQVALDSNPCHLPPATRHRHPNQATSRCSPSSPTSCWLGCRR